MFPGIPDPPIPPLHYFVVRRAVAGHTLRNFHLGQNELSTGAQMKSFLAVTVFLLLAPCGIQASSRPAPIAFLMPVTPAGIAALGAQAAAPQDSTPATSNPELASGTQKKVTAYT